MRNVMAALAALLVALPAAAQTIPQHFGGFALTGGTATCGVPAPGNAMIYTSGDASAAIDISAGLVGTVTFQASYDTANFFNIPASPQGGGPPVSSTTTSGRWQVIVGAYRMICATITAYTSGSANVTLTSSPAPLTIPPTSRVVVHQPGAATQATASIAAAAGVRHVATGCLITISTVAAQPDIVAALRDGATGAGTLIGVARLNCAIATPCIAWIQAPNAVGSVNTAMTCETASATPAAGNLATATLYFYDLQ